VELKSAWLQYLRLPKQADVKNDVKNTNSGGHDLFMERSNIGCDDLDEKQVDHFSVINFPGIRESKSR